MSDDTWIVVLAAVPVLYVSTFVHELGHALMGCMNGLTVTSLGLGLGRPFIALKWRGTRIYFGLKAPLLGITWVVYTQVYPSRRTMVAMLAGGVTANMLAAAGAVLLWRLLPWGTSLWVLIAVINLAFGIPNLIPFAFRAGNFTLASDGALIVQALWRGHVCVSPAQLFQTVDSMSSFWETIGDSRIHRAYLLSAALMWLNLGDGEQARAYFAKADSLPEDDSLYLRALAAAVNAFMACDKQEPEISAAAFDNADQLFARLKEETGRFLVALGRTQLALQEGATLGAQAMLEPLRSQALLRPMMHIAFLETNISMRAIAVAGGELEQARAEFESIRQRYSTADTDLRVYRTLGTYYSRRGDWARAEAAYRMALTSARQLCLEFSDSDLERFRNCQQTLLAEAGQCLRELSKEKEIADLEAALPTREQLNQEQTKSKERRNRLQQQAGLALVLVDFIIGMGMLLAAGVFTQEPAHWQMFPIFLAVPFVFVSVVMGLSCFVIYVNGWFNPAVRPKGEVTLGGALFAWVLALFVFVWHIAAEALRSN